MFVNLLNFKELRTHSHTGSRSERVQHSGLLASNLFELLSKTTVVCPFLEIVLEVKGTGDRGD